MKTHNLINRTLAAVNTDFLLHRIFTQGPKDPHYLHCKYMHTFSQRCAKAECRRHSGVNICPRKSQTVFLRIWDFLKHGPIVKTFKTEFQNFKNLSSQILPKETRTFAYIDFFLFCIFGTLKLH